MRILTAKIVSDESGRPVSVNMDDDEFLKVKAEVEGVYARPDEATMLENHRRMLACGGTVDFGGEDGLEYQRRLRAEWD